MALETLLAPQTGAGTSDPIVCDGISAITIGIYASGPITDRVGAYISLDDPDDTELLRLTGRVIALSPARPSVTLKNAGNYYVTKPATAQAIGVYGYPSEGGTPELLILGDNGSGGGGNWPTAEDRGLMAPFALATQGTFNTFYMRTRAGSGAGVSYKGYVYFDDGGAAGMLACSTAAMGPIAAGVQEISGVLTGTTTVAAGTYWIGYVADGGGSGETDSGGTNAALTRMYNGDLSYASIPSPAPTWSGVPGAYSNVPASWVTYSL